MYVCACVCACEYIMQSIKHMIISHTDILAHFSSVHSLETKIKNGSDDFNEEKNEPAEEEEGKIIIIKTNQGFNTVRIIQRYNIFIEFMNWCDFLLLLSGCEVMIVSLLCAGCCCSCKILNCEKIIEQNQTKNQNANIKSSPRSSSSLSSSLFLSGCHLVSNVTA